MLDKLKQLLIANKVTVILVISLAGFLIGGLFFFQKINSDNNANVEEVDLPFEAEGPYAVLSPRRDGNALVLNLKRTASYDSISYELAYTSKADETAVRGSKILDGGESNSADGVGSIDRGVVGTIDTKEKKGEYEQEILFGTCSKNVCKYDKGVENGTLTLHIKKGAKAYRMVTQWHLQQPDVALGSLSSGDGHLVYKLDSDRQQLTSIGFSIINDLTGVPKLSNGKTVFGKVYSLNIPIAKVLPAGSVKLELADNPPAGAKLARYDESQNKWVELDAKLDGSKFNGKADSGGIFAVLVSK